MFKLLFAQGQQALERAYPPGILLSTNTPEPQNKMSSSSSSSSSLLSTLDVPPLPSFPLPSSKRARVVDPSSIVESSLIWIQGTGAGSRGSVLVSLAQSGYTREVHQIIGLSHTASLIGRDSDGGLPELWDIMGQRKSKQGITRLMAICLTRGSLSPSRALALIRDHNVTVNVKDNLGRTALLCALGLTIIGTYYNIVPTPINIELIHVLAEASSSDEINKIPFRALSAPALVALSSHKVVKENVELVKKVIEALLNITKTTAGAQTCIDAGATAALVSLSREQAIKKDDSAIRRVAEALMNLSASNAGRQSCIDAGATSALSDISREMKWYSWAMESITGALMNISVSKAGQKACIDADVPAILTAYVFENKSERYSWFNSDLAERVASALWNISKSTAGLQACVDAKALSALTFLACEKTVMRNVKAARMIAGALFCIAMSENGRQAFIDSEALYAMVALTHEKVVMDDIEAVKSLAAAFSNISKSDAGVKACIDAGVPSALSLLAREKAIIENAQAAWNVADALNKIAISMEGKQACIKARAPSSLTALAREQIVMENAVTAAMVAEAFKTITGKELI